MLGHLNVQKYDSAFFYYEQAKSVATSKEQKAYALNQIAELQRFFVISPVPRLLQQRPMKTVTIQNTYPIYTIH